MTIRFPYSRPSLTEDDIQAAVEVMRTPMLTQGNRGPEFEAAFSQAVGAKYTVASANGTAALHLAYMALGIGPEAGVIVPAITFLATANAARMCDAPVHFADVDEQSGCITPETLEQALRDCPFPVRAASVVHLAGRPCDMARLKTVADQYGCLLVEDACHAPGAYYCDQDGLEYSTGACAHSAAAAFSFHAIKHISSGEGGCTTTADPGIADAMARLRTHGMVRDPQLLIDQPEAHAPWYYEMHELGWNYRLTEIQVALALPQVQRLKDNIAKRQKLADRYDQLFAGDNRIGCAVPVDPGGQHAWHLYQIRVPFEREAPSRGEVMRRLAEKGIGTQVHYIPLPRQPYYRALDAVNLPGAEAFYASTLSIPMYESLDPADQAEIVAKISQAIEA